VPAAALHSLHRAPCVLCVAGDCPPAGPRALCRVPCVARPATGRRGLCQRPACAACVAGPAWRALRPARVVRVACACGWPVRLVLLALRGLCPRPARATCIAGPAVRACVARLACVVGLVCPAWCALCGWPAWPVRGGPVWALCGARPSGVAIFFAGAKVLQPAGVACGGPMWCSGPISAVAVRGVPSRGLFLRSAACPVWRGPAAGPRGPCGRCLSSSWPSCPVSRALRGLCQRPACAACVACPAWRGPAVRSLCGFLSGQSFSPNRQRFGKRFGEVSEGVSR